MPKRCQFAERQYEQTFNNELGSVAGGAFVPTQPLEMYLGIDAATDAKDAHRIWEILNANIPRRVTLSPKLWPQLPLRFYPEISGRIVSLFFQFKVPKYNDAKRGKHRIRFGSPYYEVAITRHQHDALVALQRRVQSRALVRYASPTFWTRLDFDKYAISRQVLSKSAYLIPSRVGRHKKWMYAVPSGRTILNPDPEEIESVDWEIILGSLREQAREESLQVHVASLAKAVRETQIESDDQQEPNWISAMRRYARAWQERLSPQEVEYLMNYRTIVDAAELADTTWTVIVFPDSKGRSMLDLMEEHAQWCWRLFGP